MLGSFEHCFEMNKEEREAHNARVSEIHALREREMKFKDAYLKNMLEEAWQEELKREQGRQE